MPCLGPGWEAWTSDDSVDQELAADLCLLCPVFDHCEAYAETARPAAGTWAATQSHPRASRKPGSLARGSPSSRTRARRALDLPARADAASAREVVATSRGTTAATSATYCGISGRARITAETAREALSESPRLRGKLDGYLRPAPLS